MAIKDGIRKTNAENVISFLMIGQSNMAGRGDFGEVPPIENDKCFMLRMGRWQPMSEPINPDRCVLGSSFHSGVCLAASFADEVSREYGVEVGLIPCADGGTRISQWQPGEVLYDHAVAMARLAMRSSELGGIIWHQGESDCDDDALDEAEYSRKFLSTMTSLRRDLGAENIPLIIGEISDKITEEWGFGDSLRRINPLLHRLKDQVPLCGIASAEGLQLKEDGIHFDSAACRELGKRYFEEYRKLKGKNT